MSRIGTLTRRTFLVGSAAIGGGVVFGAYQYRQAPENPLLRGLKDGEAAITPYVKIDSSGITLITTHSDLGQGARSIQAALIAEELDVELDQVNLDPGLPDAAYYNTALKEDFTPLHATYDEMPAEALRTTVDAATKFLGLQATGSSTTVPDQYEKLRMAGAVARETIKQAAALQAGVDRSQLETENGLVKFPDGTRKTYQELAAEAAKVDPVSDVELRKPSQWRMIGKPMLRSDIKAKSTGQQGYGIDTKIDGMLFAAIKTNPRHGGSMIDYDASQAEAMRGVEKVIALEDGVAVIANNSWRAFQAVEAISTNWSDAPYPAEMDEHWELLEQSLEAKKGFRFRDKGNVDAAFAETVPTERVYRAPYLAHAPLEPLAATVWVQQDRVDVWATAQIPRFVQSNVAKITRRNVETVFVHMLPAGGSFGHRIEDEFIKYAAIIATQMPGTPIKLTYSREQDFAVDYPRQIAMAKASGTVKDGQVDTLDLSIAMPSAIKSQMGRQNIPVPVPDTGIVAGAWDQPFTLPNYRVYGTEVDGLAPVGWWRAVGASTNGFFHDCALDELIHEAGADPLEERLRLTWHQPSRKVLEAVAEMSNWGSALPQNKGRGVAFCLSFGVPTAQIVELTNTTEGIKLDKVFVALDVGRIVDPVNFENQVQGGVIWGLGHAMNCEFTYSDGMAQQSNYHAYEGMRMYQCPHIEVRGLENGSKVRGVGEPSVPPAPAALANAIFAATGKRIREMPFNKHIRFV